MSAVEDLVGHTLGPYSIVERIGRGGMADVYRALHTALNVPRALKVIRAELGDSEDFRVRFRKEAQSVAALRHQNIVQVHDFGTEGALNFMVMEFIDGHDLKHFLHTEGRIRPVGRAVELIQQIAGALEYAHARGLIHRDIKPANIMITTGGLPILTDFGIAKLLTADTHLTQTGAAIGTPAYMAPEQILGGTDVGPATDVYSLSVVLYELLTGRVPFAADTPMGVLAKVLSEPLPKPQTLCSDIGEELQNVLLKGTAKSSAGRFDTVTSFRKALAEAMAISGMDSSPGLSTGVAHRARLDGHREQPTTQRGMDTLLREAQPPRYSSKSVLLGGIGAIALLGAGVYYWHESRPVAPVPPVTVASGASPAATPAVTTSPTAAPEAARPSAETPPAAAKPMPVVSGTPARNPAAAHAGRPPPRGRPIRDLFAGTISALFQGTTGGLVPAVSQGVTGPITSWFDRRRRDAALAYADPSVTVQVYDTVTGQPAAADANPYAFASTGHNHTLYAGMAFEVHALSGGGTAASVNVATYVFHTGDRFTVYVRPSMPGRLEVYNVNSLGKQTDIDSVTTAAGQLTTLGPYEFTATTGDESLHLVLSPCSSATLLAITRDIVNISDTLSAEGAVPLRSCGAPLTRGITGLKTRDIQKIAVDATTSFALDPLAQTELSSGQVVPREVTIAFHHM